MLGFVIVYSGVSEIKVEWRRTKVLHRHKEKSLNKYHEPILLPDDAYITAIRKQLHCKNKQLVRKLVHVALPPPPPPYLNRANDNK